MDKRYTNNPADAIPIESIPDYSIPEDNKQATGYAEPEMFVKQHKTLPHLKGRRMYQAGETESPTRPSATEEVPATATFPEKAEEQKTGVHPSPSMTFYYPSRIIIRVYSDSSSSGSTEAKSRP